MAATVVLLTAAPAILEGRYSRRWSEGANVNVAEQALAGVPNSIGPWDRVEDGEALSEMVTTELGLLHYVNRVYRHRTSGQSLSLLIMAGKPGPLVRHPPEICYANQNYRPTGPEEMLMVDGPPPGQFRLLRFGTRASIFAERFLVTYSHTADGAWSVPSWPRFRFGGEPLLYKMQLRMQQRDEEDVKELRSFLEEFTAAFAGSLDAAHRRLRAPADRAG